MKRVCRFACSALLSVFQIGGVALGAEPDARIVEMVPQVTYERFGIPKAATNKQPLLIGDIVRTAEHSTALLRLNNRTSSLRLREKTTIQIKEAESSVSLLNLLKGSFYFYSRDEAGDKQFTTPYANGAFRGTEAVITVGDGFTSVATREGIVELTNTLGRTTVLPGQFGLAESNKPPRTSLIQATNLVQWWLFYPAVVDPGELDLKPAEDLSESLEIYRTGDVIAAVKRVNWETRGSPLSIDERIYLAGLKVAAGEVADGEEFLKPVSIEDSRAAGLRWMINAVQGKTNQAAGAGRSATELIGLSYYAQANRQLESALERAEEAARRSPRFAYAWARVAELQFSFGNIKPAREALGRALELGPLNAQSHALRGFLFAAEAQWQDAVAAFDRAIELESRLANAWLGRGLTQIRRRNDAQGLEDLKTAAALEPDRSALRSYLSKAYDLAGRGHAARTELKRATELDPLDPTPSLYSALLKFRAYEINSAVAELERSAVLNNNRQVYRSSFLLDQDRAVRSANLARIYQQAGLSEVSLREAAKATAYDYSSYSAHQFLAESYNALVDPNRFNLRYITAYFNELVLANLLAPVGAGTLSPSLSNYEYSRLFDRNRIGFNSQSEYFSDGRFRQVASQYGVIGSTAWSLDADYSRETGSHPNGDLSRLEWYSQIKQQLTPEDTLLLFLKFQDYEAGDNFNYRDPNQYDPQFRFEEDQKPWTLLGYHREWSPGIHTLFFGGRMINDARFDSSSRSPHLTIGPAGDLQAIVDPPAGSQFLRNDSEIYTMEANQIFDSDRQTLLLGGRYQDGAVVSHERIEAPGYESLYTGLIPARSIHDVDSRRGSAYVYHTTKALDRVALTLGLSYDHMEYPANFRNPPLTDITTSKDMWSPKLGLVWNVSPRATLRGLYAKSLGGITYDDSVRLEPVQIAGFSQSLRNLAPETITSSLEAPAFETIAVVLDLKLPKRFYVGLNAELYSAEADQRFGAFRYFYAETPPNIRPSTERNEIEYSEPSVAFTVNRLVGEEWSLGASWKFSQADVTVTKPDLAMTSALLAVEDGGSLHTGSAYVLFNHRSGFFAQTDVIYHHQEVKSLANIDPSESALNWNSKAGWRFWSQRGEFVIGLLNMTDSDHRLHPLNVYTRLPRERTFYAKLRISL
jgi:Tfp pilus assembly protein PilF